MVCCVFSLESPHRGDSNEYTQYTIFNIKKENHPKLSQICSYVIFSKGLKNKFETAMVNEPLAFEPLKFYCINTVQIVCIGTDRSQQTVQTKIRLLLKKQSDQGLRCLPFYQHLLDALMQCYIKFFYF